MLIYADKSVRQPPGPGSVQCVSARGPRVVCDAVPGSRRRQRLTVRSLGDAEGTEGVFIA